MSNSSFSDLARFAITVNKGKDESFASRVQFWIDQLGDIDIATITTDMVEDGVDTLIKRGKVRVINLRGQAVYSRTGQPHSGSTINRYVASLGSVFKILKAHRKLPRGFNSPMRGVTRGAEGQGRTVSVTTADVQRLINCCRVSRNRKLAAMVSMACTTGWRKGSLQSLTWGAVDLKAGHADTQTTKNGTPHRTVLLPSVIEELRRIRPEQATDSDLVFGATCINKAWRNAVKLAGLPEEWTFHHCRHIAASVLAQSGASTIQIMSCLNHKTPLMAMRYSHLNTDSMRESMGKAWG